MSERESLMRRVDLLELRDARYSPAPWYRWVLVDVDENVALGYFKRRIDAEREMAGWLSEEDDA